MGFSILLHQLMLRCGLESNQHAWSVGTCLNQRDIKLEPKKSKDLHWTKVETEGGNRFDRRFLSLFFLIKSCPSECWPNGASDILNAFHLHVA